MTDIVLRDYFERILADLQRSNEQRLLDFDRRITERLAEGDRRLTEHFQVHASRISERFVASEAAVAKAERTMNDRLNSMNEFRDALRDQSNKMATRMELAKVEEIIQGLVPRVALRVDVDKLDEAIQELQRAKANLDGRMVVLSSSISIVMSLIVWGLSKILP